jgi:hypothetical protein
VATALAGSSGLETSTLDCVRSFGSNAGLASFAARADERPMSEKFARHRQPWTLDENAKLHTLAGKGMGLKAIAKALTRSEESTQAQAKVLKVKIAKMR